MRSELYISFVREVVVVEYPSGEKRIIMYCLSRHCLASSIVPPRAGGDRAGGSGSGGSGRHRPWFWVLVFGCRFLPAKWTSRFLLPISSRQIIDESISIADFFIVCLAYDIVRDREIRRHRHSTHKTEHQNIKSNIHHHHHGQQHGFHELSSAAGEAPATAHLHNNNNIIVTNKISRLTAGISTNFITEHRGLVVD